MQTVSILALATSAAAFMKPAAPAASAGLKAAPVFTDVESLLASLLRPERAAADGLEFVEKNPG